MRVFEQIKRAVFGEQLQPVTTNPISPPKYQPIGTTSTLDNDVEEEVDVDRIDTFSLLEQRAEERGFSDSWKHQVIPLLGLLEIDSSLPNRCRLAVRYGYQGPLDGSVEMNLWLHHTLIRVLALNGGKLPGIRTIDED